MSVKRTGKILMGVVAAGGVVAGGFALFHHYVVRDSNALDSALHRFEEIIRPVTEADAILRYDSAHSQFSVSLRADPQRKNEIIPEVEMAEYLRRSMTASPKLVVIYQESDFPKPAERAALQGRLRATLQSAGAASVTFVVVQQDAGKSSLLDGVDH